MDLLNSSNSKDLKSSKSRNKSDSNVFNPLDVKEKTSQKSVLKDKKSNKDKNTTKAIGNFTANLSNYHTLPTLNVDSGIVPLESFKINLNPADPKIYKRVLDNCNFEAEVIHNLKKYVQTIQFNGFGKSFISKLPESDQNAVVVVDNILAEHSEIKSYFKKLLKQCSSSVNYTDRRLSLLISSFIEKGELALYSITGVLKIANPKAILDVTGTVAYQKVDNEFDEEFYQTYVLHKFVPSLTAIEKYSNQIEEKEYTLNVFNNFIFEKDEIRVFLNLDIDVAYYVNTIKNRDKILGRIQFNSNKATLIPDNKNYKHLEFIFENSQAIGEAKMGDIVICNITKRIVQKKSKDYGFVVEVAQVLGDFDRLDVLIKMAIERSAIPHEWNEKVQKQVANIPDEVLENEKQNRVDLRKLPLVTIDGEDARDFDDAVYCKKETGGFRLYVAIADVSNYVRPSTPLDKEAQSRGNSVYFPNYVVPMLPEKLSNGLCSLNPYVDRLCMVCEVFVSKDGSLGEYKFYPAVMNSHARFTYTEVSSILAGNKPSSQDFEPLIPDLNNLYDLFKALKQARTNRGGIEFETEESTFVFDENLNIADIVPVKRNDAHMMIEECMIAANVCAAKFVEANKGYTLFRVHAKPSATKLATFRQYIAESGLTLEGGDEPTSIDYANFVRSTENHPNQKMLLTMMLRSMSLAEYTPENGGHFGLALGQYAHFTSPIRRYPDLQLHREIKYILGKQGFIDEVNNVRFDVDTMNKIGAKVYFVEELETLGEKCNTTERRADKVTGEVAQSLKAKFISQFIGEVFHVVVSNVTSFGLFVNLEKFNISGLVHITSFKQYFSYDSENGTLYSDSTTYKAGDSLYVRLVDVDVLSGHIVFEPVNTKVKSNPFDNFKGCASINNGVVNSIIRNSLLKWEDLKEQEEQNNSSTDEEVIYNDTKSELGISNVTTEKVLKSFKAKAPKVKSVATSENKKRRIQKLNLLKKQIPKKLLVNEKKLPRKSLMLSQKRLIRI